jgi:hypothetical protein
VIAQSIDCAHHGGTTRRQDRDHQRRDQRLEKSLAHASPLPRSGLADDAANAALFLASD